MLLIVPMIAANTKTTSNTTSNVTMKMDDADDEEDDNEQEEEEEEELGPFDTFIHRYVHSGPLVECKNK